MLRENSRKSYSEAASGGPPPTPPNMPDLGAQKSIRDKVLWLSVQQNLWNWASVEHQCRLLLLPPPGCPCMGVCEDVVQVT